MQGVTEALEGDGGPLVQQDGVLGVETVASQPWPGGPAGLGGHTTFKHCKMLCNVVQAVKIVRSPEAT